MKKMTSTCIIELNENEIRVLTQLSMNLKTSPSGNAELFCKEAKHFISSSSRTYTQNSIKFYEIWFRNRIFINKRNNNIRK